MIIIDISDLNIQAFLYMKAFSLFECRILPGNLFKDAKQNKTCIFHGLRKAMREQFHENLIRRKEEM